MILYIGADHRGFELKEALRQFLKDSGYSVTDMGAASYDKGDDFVDFARLVAGKVSADIHNSKGILICGSGVGVDIVANRFPNIRSALAFSADQAIASRSEDDANVLSLPADFVDLEQAKKIVSVWMQTPFSNEERYRRRIEKIQNIDSNTID